MAPTDAGPKHPARKPPRTKPGGGGGSVGGGGASGAAGIAEAGQAWAQRPPETLVAARSEAQEMSEALGGLADAFLRRMNLETERSIAPSCVEPYQQCAQLARQMGEHCQEVHRLLVQRYGATADDLARPDTPEPEYLKEGT